MKFDRLVFLVEVSLKVVDINDEDERRRYEGERSRMRSMSSQKLVQTETKPVSLYVTNWTDDEKYRRTQDPLRFNDTQLADR